MTGKIVQRPPAVPAKEKQIAKSISNTEFSGLLIIDRVHQDDTPNRRRHESCSPAGSSYCGLNKRRYSSFRKPYRSVSYRTWTMDGARKLNYSNSDFGPTGLHQHSNDTSTSAQPYSNDDSIFADCPDDWMSTEPPHSSEKSPPATPSKSSISDEVMNSSFSSCSDADNESSDCFSAADYARFKLKMRRSDTLENFRADMESILTNTCDDLQRIIDLRNAYSLTLRGPHESSKSVGYGSDSSGSGSGSDRFSSGSNSSGFATWNKRQPSKPKTLCGLPKHFLTEPEGKQLPLFSESAPPMLDTNSMVSRTDEELERISPSNATGPDRSNTCVLLPSHIPSRDDKCHFLTPSLSPCDSNSPISPTDRDGSIANGLTCATNSDSENNNASCDKCNGLPRPPRIVYTDVSPTGASRPSSSPVRSVDDFKGPDEAVDYLRTEMGKLRLKDLEILKQLTEVQWRMDHLRSDLLSPGDEYETDDSCDTMDLDPKLPPFPKCLSGGHESST